MERELLELAERQHGVFSRRQALADGVTVDAIKHRLRTGRWEPVGLGVYRVAGSRPTWEQRLTALTLAAGPGAAASHRSAAALLGVPGFRRTMPLEVTTTRCRRHRQRLARIHQTTVLPARHLTRVEGILVTGPARTLLDLAATVPPQRTERALDNCLSFGLVTVDSVAAVLDAVGGRGRAGSSLLARLLAERHDGYVPPASELEARFLHLVRSAGLPEPVRQLDCGDGEGWVGRVDFAYPGVRVLIELDSRRHHSSRLDFESDRARDNRLVAGGWRLLRLTWHDVTRRPDDVVELLRRTCVT
jgi:hypothetical protein